MVSFDQRTKGQALIGSAVADDNTLNDILDKCGKIISIAAMGWGIYLFIYLIFFFFFVKMGN